MARALIGVGLLWVGPLGLAAWGAATRPVLAEGLYMLLYAAAACLTIIVSVRIMFDHSVVRMSRRVLNLGAQLGVRFGTLDDEPAATPVVRLSRWTVAGLAVLWGACLALAIWTATGLEASVLAAGLYAAVMTVTVVTVIDWVFRRRMAEISDVMLEMGAKIGARRYG